jgi:hypothetical protein
LNTGGSTTYGDYVMLNNTSGTDVYLHEGDGLDILRSSANYAGYKLNQSWGKLSNGGGGATAITSTATAVDFSASQSNGNITASTTSNNFTATAAGDYEVNATIRLTGTATRAVRLGLTVNGTVGNDRNTTSFNGSTVTEDGISLSTIVTLTAGQTVGLEIVYLTTTGGSGTDISYYYPIFTLKRLK